MYEISTGVLFLKTSRWTCHQRNLGERGFFPDSRDDKLTSSEREKKSVLESEDAFVDAIIVPLRWINRIERIGTRENVFLHTSTTDFHFSSLLVDSVFDTRIIPYPMDDRYINTVVADHFIPQLANALGLSLWNDLTFQR